MTSSLFRRLLFDLEPHLGELAGAARAMAAYVDSGSFIDSEDTGLLFITGHLRDALKSLDQLHRELFDEVIGKLKLPGAGSPPGAPPAG